MTIKLNSRLNLVHLISKIKKTENWSPFVQLSMTWFIFPLTNELHPDIRQYNRTILRTLQFVDKAYPLPNRVSTSFAPWLFLSSQQLLEMKLSVAHGETWSGSGFDIKYLWHKPEMPAREPTRRTQCRREHGGPTKALTDEAMEVTSFSVQHYTTKIGRKQSEQFIRQVEIFRYQLTCFIRSYL